MLTNWTPQSILLSFITVTCAFLIGLGLGSMNDPTEAPAPEVVEVKVPHGDFEDVPLSMEVDSGNTFHWICDMHFGVERSAECEYQP